MECVNTDDRKKHIVILVHGIRTFGAWQERFAILLKRYEPGVETHVYKYGYFSSLAFLIPFLRIPVRRRFRRYLASKVHDWEGMRVDIVAHSFGTYVTAWALRGLTADQCPRIHTIIFCGSVLKQLFPWDTFVGRDMPVTRVINDCGTKDIWPVIGQLFVLGMGIAGRRGFAGVTGADVGIINRYFPIGHSGFFPDTFMQERWVPLLTGTTPPLTGAEIIPPTPRWSAALEYYADPIKLVFLLLPFIIALYIWQAQNLEIARAEARAAQEELARLTAEERQRHEEQARVAAEKRQREEESLKLVAEANRILYRIPQQALLLATRASEISQTALTEAAQRAALNVMKKRRNIQIEETSQWNLGAS